MNSDSKSKERGIIQWKKGTPPENTEDVPLTPVIQLEELGINWEVVEETGEADIPF